METERKEPVKADSFQEKGVSSLTFSSEEGGVALLAPSKDAASPSSPCPVGCSLERAGRSLRGEVSTSFHPSEFLSQVAGEGKLTCRSLGRAVLGLSS